MQLRVARLCMDCEEVHDGATCPACGSETFAYLSRWVPAPEGARSPRPASSAEAEVFRELLEPDNARPKRRFRGGLLGLTALGLAGWAWRSARRDSTAGDDGATPHRPDAVPPGDAPDDAPSTRRRPSSTSGG